MSDDIYGFEVKRYDHRDSDHSLIDIQSSAYVRAQSRYRTGRLGEPRREFAGLTLGELAEAREWAAGILARLVTMLKRDLEGIEWRCHCAKTHPNNRECYFETDDQISVAGDRRLRDPDAVELESGPFANFNVPTKHAARFAELATQLLTQLLAPHPWAGSTEPADPGPDRDYTEKPGDVA